MDAHPDKTQHKERSHEQGLGIAVYKLKGSL